MSEVAEPATFDKCERVTAKGKKRKVDRGCISLSLIKISAVAAHPAHLKAVLLDFQVIGEMWVA